MHFMILQTFEMCLTCLPEDLFRKCYIQYKMANLFQYCPGPLYVQSLLPNCWFIITDIVRLIGLPTPSTSLTALIMM